MRDSPEVNGNAEILRALHALGAGDFDKRLSTGHGGVSGAIAEAFNHVARLSGAMATELARVSDQLRKDGRIGQRARIDGAEGAWARCAQSINALIDEFARPASDALSEAQQRDLQRTNAELKEKARQLSEQMQEVEYKNREIEAARNALEQKAEQLLLSSRYKSEFLANMSHELRTPLNSLLILAQLLAENASGNLTPKQVEYAQTICISGNDLLAVINDILDLSKIESGTVTLSVSSESLADVKEYVERAFRQVAHDRGLTFTIAMDRDLPLGIRTDMKRLRQILQNLLSNAFKFTLQGGVALRIAGATGGWKQTGGSLDQAQSVVAFSVTDTGIGIAEDKQQIIFEAFRQADGTTSRQFEGTGLGLSISSELARLLGGEIRVDSTLGKGSTFTLYLPAAFDSESGAHEASAMRESVEQTRQEQTGAREPRQIVSIVPDDSAEGFEQRDDRDRIRPGDRVVLIVADDSQCAVRLPQLVREQGFKVLRAANAHTALALANEYMPNAVTVDIKNRNTGGWAIMNLLKQDPDTRHIPVNILYVDDQQRSFACMCALGIVNTPSREDTLREALGRLPPFRGHEARTLLVAAGSRPQREALSAAVAGAGLQVISVGTGKQALKVLRKTAIDCAIVSQSLVDLPDFIRDLVLSPSVVQTFIVLHSSLGHAASRDTAESRELAEILWLKRALSADAILAETALCLHQAIKEMPPGHRRPLASMRKSVPALDGRKVLVVDDDIRNIFALTGALEQQGMTVLNAESGPDGIETLKANPDIDIVLMDIMMPEQDGYETMRVIRGLPEFQAIPIIGVTAKAMKGDREKCIEAGATDYIAKPVNVEKLLSLMRMWIAG
ncbi:MAG TPA: response regulator [Sphingomicrobium sp.]|nr:response regulator [Sphingomicrobium sp.]